VPQLLYFARFILADKTFHWLWKNTNEHGILPHGLRNAFETEFNMPIQGTDFYP